MKLEHIGVAVKSIEEGIKIWQSIFDAELKGIAEVESQKVRLAMLTVGGIGVELIEPTSKDSTVAKFLEKRGEGLHHICFAVKDIDSVISELKNKTMIDNKPRPGAFSKKIAFLHPSSTCGVLIEIAEK